MWLPSLLLYGHAFKKPTSGNSIPMAWLPQVRGGLLPLTYAPISKPMVVQSAIERS